MEESAFFHFFFIKRKYFFILRLLVASLLQNVGFIPNICLKERCETSLDEEQVLKLSNRASCDPWFRPTDSFKYFFCDNNFILAVTKTDDTEDSLETFVILRGASGKTVWKMKQKMKSSKSSQLTELHHKLAQPAPEIRVTPEHEMINSLPVVELDELCKADSALPPLGKIFNKTILFKSSY